MQDLDGVRRQRKQALFVSFPQHAKLGIGQLQVVELKSQGLTRAQAVEQHQGDDRQISKSAKAVPERGDFIGRKGNDETTRFSEPQAKSGKAMGTAKAESRPCEERALQQARARGQWMPSM